MMERKAFINGKEYRLIEEVTYLDTMQKLILCVNKSDVTFACSEQTWSKNEIVRKQGLENQLQETKPAITGQSSTQEKIDLFLAMFKGREDVFARRFYSSKTGKSGYAPVCKNEWNPMVCDKKRYRCSECPNREFVSLTYEIIKSHLIGRDLYCRDVVAIYPMLEDNTTNLLVVDFDKEHWKEDVAAFCQTCRGFGLLPAVERSRSGNGVHIWFFFEEPVQACDARRLGTALLTRTMELRHELSFESYDRLFPSQDTVAKSGFGNLIALPFQGQAQKKGNSLFVNEEFVPYPDQWAYLSGISKIKEKQLQMIIESLSDSYDLGELACADEKQLPWKRIYRGKMISHNDFPQNVEVIQGNLLYVEKKGFSQAALNTIKRLAAFPNPEFRMKQVMRLPVYQTPRIIDCGYEDEIYLGLPRGCFDVLKEILDQYDVRINLDDRRNEGRSIDVSFCGELRDEQKPAAEALVAAEMGVLSATTAFGKTVIGAWLIGQRKVNTLILVQSSALLEQWKNSLEQFLEICEVLPELPKKRGRKKQRSVIGQVGSGKNTRSGIVDIAIMQSLFEGDEKEVKDFVSEYGMILVDECHHIAAFTFEKVLKASSAKYVYGLSATPVRKDGHHPIIFMQCGPIRYLVDAKSQAEKREFLHFVIPRFTRMRASEGMQIQDVYKAIVENELRNEMIVKDVLSLVKEGRSPIVLTERKEHAAMLADFLKNRVNHVVVLIGSDKVKEKREKLQRLQELGPKDEVVVVATGKYVGEGFDWPRLDTLLLAMPISWKGTLAQYAGRLHRNYDGKKEVRIYDYVDVQIPMLDRMHHKRLKGYKELGYQVKFDSTANPVSMIYNGHEAMAVFEKDLAEATRSILIVSAYRQEGRVAQLQTILGEAKERGVKVDLNDSIQQRYAIIDEWIVWYGNVDFLAYGRKDSDVLRFENRDVAGELLMLAKDGEQVML